MSASLRAQQPPSGFDPQSYHDVKRVYLKLNPFTILSGPILNTSEYRLGFEFVGGHRFTYELHGSYLAKWVLLNSAFVDDTTRVLADQLEFPGFRLQGMAKYFFFKARPGKELEEYLSPTGFYVGLHGSYAAAQLRIKGQSYPKQDWSNLQVTSRLGLQFIYEENFGIDVFMGLGYKQNRAFNTDYRQRTTSIDIKEELNSPIGNYIASPFKFSFGFSFTVGLL